MIFRPELVEAIVEARKTQTRRMMSMNPNSPWYRERCRYKKGGVYAVQPGRSERGVAKIEVTHVRKQMLGEISAADAVAEGFSTPVEFAAYWRKMHGSFPMAVEVWVIEFMLVDRTGWDQAIEDNIAAAEIEQDVREQAALDAKLRERPKESRYDG